MSGGPGWHEESGSLFCVFPFISTTIPTTSTKSSGSVGNGCANAALGADAHRRDRPRKRAPALRWSKSHDGDDDTGRHEPAHGAKPLALESKPAAADARRPRGR